VKLRRMLDVVTRFRDLLAPIEYETQVKVRKRESRSFEANQVRSST